METLLVILRYILATFKQFLMIFQGVFELFEWKNIKNDEQINFEKHIFWKFENPMKSISDDAQT